MRINRGFMHVFLYAVLHAKKFFDYDKTAGKRVRFSKMYTAWVLCKRFIHCKLLHRLTTEANDGHAHYAGGG